MERVLIAASVKNYLELLRVKQYVKNLFVFIPAFFAGQLMLEGVFLKHVTGFVAFSLVASAIYILNDYLDVEKDRLHPTKQYRPLASGVIGINSAFILFISCLSAGLWIAYLMEGKFFLLLTGYLLMNFAYCFVLKKISLIDVSVIAFGFLFRVFSGGEIADVIVSKWLVIMTFLLALLLGMAKRRDDVLIKVRSGQEMRKSIQGYNLDFLNIAMVLLAAVTIVSYIMYTISPEVIERINNDYIYLTAFFVLMGILRYLQIAVVEEKSGSPTEVLLKDGFIQITLFGWFLTFAIILYVV
ncbi:decaprenyl-phosphate phosphoribosyltransferase [soil metagenome]